MASHQDLEASFFVATSGDPATTAMHLSRNSDCGEPKAPPKAALRRTFAAPFLGWTPPKMVAFLWSLFKDTQNRVPPKKTGQTRDGFGRNGNGSPLQLGLQLHYLGLLWLLSVATRHAKLGGIPHLKLNSAA